MNKQELIEWLLKDLPDGPVSEKDLAKAFLSTMRNQSVIMKDLATELEKLDPKNTALNAYRKFTAVQI